ncbi:MAG: dihydrolipoamide acetyltransferase family protein [Candidatus Nanohalobium sp.]
MKFEFPDTGEGVTEGEFLEWKVEEGDEIDEDQVVGEAETDKAVVEIPAPADGIVESLKVSPGDNVEVGEVIMELDAGDVSEEAESSEPEVEEKDKEEEQKDEQTSNQEEELGENNAESSGDVLALPKVRKLAEEKNVDLASIKTGERITEDEVLEAAGEENLTETVEENKTEEAEEKIGSVKTSQDVDATPAVRKLAREKGVDIGKIEGSGRGGKVTREDVLDFEEDAKTSQTEEKDTGERSQSSVSGEELSNLEKNIARKMEESRFSAPHVTHIEKADVTRLVEIREEADSDVDAHLTYMPFIMKACMLAARKYPRANAHFDGDSMEIDTKDSYNFNIAVDTERGLLVPRIDNVGEKNLLELAQNLGDTVEKAQNGKISSEEMQPGSFSITNIGVIGGEAFTPIINPPQTCIMGVGKIQETAEVVKGEVEARTTVKLSFSYDHRVLDGATAARFVNEVVENLENPEEMMVEL